MKRCLVVIMTLGMLPTTYAQGETNRDTLQGSWVSPCFRADDLNFQVQVSDELSYVGAHTFRLYNVAEVERHYFIASTNDEIIKLLVFQFEAYDSTNTYAYRVPSDNLETISGLQFGSNDDGVGLIHLGRFLERWRGRGTEYEVSKSWLQARGYRLPEELALLVRTHIREGRRKELIVLYWESLDAMQLSFESLGVPEEDIRSRVPEFLLSSQYTTKLASLNVLRKFLIRARNVIR